MILNIENCRKKEDDTIVTLGLRSHESGRVALVAIDDEGTCWNLLYFHPNGEIELAEYISESVGFDINDRGQLSFS